MTARWTRWAVARADIPELAGQLRDTLIARYRPKQRLVGPITPVIAFFQIEDGTNG